MARKPVTPRPSQYVQLLGEKAAEAKGYLGTDIVPVKDHILTDEETKRQYWLIDFAALNEKQRDAITIRVSTANNMSYERAYVMNFQNGVAVPKHLGKLIETPNTPEPPTQTSFFDAPSERLQ